MIPSYIQRLQVADHAVGVLREKCSQETGDSLPRPDVEMAEHAVIERGDDSALEDPEIAGMRICVKEPEFEDLSEQVSALP